MSSTYMRAQYAHEHEIRFAIYVSLMRLQTEWEHRLSRQLHIGHFSHSYALVIRYDRDRLQVKQYLRIFNGRPTSNGHVCQQHRRDFWYSGLVGFL